MSAPEIINNKIKNKDELCLRVPLVRGFDDSYYISVTFIKGGDKEMVIKCELGSFKGIIKLNKKQTSEFIQELVHFLKGEEDEPCWLGNFIKEH